MEEQRKPESKGSGNEPQLLIKQGKVQISNFFSSYSFPFTKQRYSLAELLTLQLPLCFVVALIGLFSQLFFFIFLCHFSFVSVDHIYSPSVCVVEAGCPSVVEDTQDLVCVNY